MEGLCKQTKRGAAYQDLVIIRKVIIIDCNVDFIKKKIYILRESLRRETKTVQKNVTASLWTMLILVS